MSAEEKRQKANEILNDFNKKYFPIDLPEYCQQDFKMCSIVAHELVTEYFDPNNGIIKDRIKSIWSGDTHHDYPLMRPNWLPIRYLGGDMCFGRVFAFNICAFSSENSIIAMRDVKYDYPHPKEAFRIMKRVEIYRRLQVMENVQTRPVLNR